MSLGLIIAGVLILAAGVILNHFFPNRYWIAVILIGVIVAVIGVALEIYYSVPHLILQTLVPLA